MTTHTCAATGRRPALDQLMSEHAGPLLTFVRTLVADHHLAEDIVQETFIQAWQHGNRLPFSEVPIRDWLMAVARGLAVTSLREVAVGRETTEPEVDVAQPDHADAAVATAEAIMLLRRLPNEHRAVLLHTYLAGRTTYQTARVLGVPVRTVRSRHHDALSTLRTSSARP
ncbi:sigma-70 family RNA polymerase sigma factor [Micromonospora lupini]|uniref:RNA polymerase sigma factor, ECF subfamily n=1 Tax=Micromonospora lupini str. Lupac 08 TaxID=1150864 RepID=I0KZP2_9ACTN|nr:sigma-70 family RNA polymerase sigma factor [Micromonospora lupini]CCH17039.1 RNA polymerase sigma factor, ECF subfamily [Micromonospora lupini str. Lupac 08]